MTRTQIDKLETSVRKHGFKQSRQITLVHQRLQVLEAKLDNVKHQTVDGLRTAMQQAIESERQRTSRLESCLASLSVPGLNERYEDVLQACSSTFDHLLDDDRELFKTHKDLKLSLKEWLCHGQGVFHIS